MSVEAVSWALSVPVGGNAKVVLLGLANHAHPDGTDSFPALARLSVYAHCDPSTVRRNLRKLEADGWIRADGLGPKGQTKWALALGGGKTQPLASASEGGGISYPREVAPVPPEPSLEPSKEPSELQTARTRDDWPKELQDTVTAQEVLDVLIEVAHDHGAVPPTRKAVGHVLLAFPDRGHRVEAHAMASWFASKQIKRVVPTYRNWLGNADPANTRNGLRAVKSAPQKLEAKSQAGRQSLQEWVAENVPDLPASQALGAAQRLQYSGQELTADRVRHHLAAVSS